MNLRDVKFSVTFLPDTYLEPENIPNVYLFCTGDMEDSKLFIIREYVILDIESKKEVSIDFVMFAESHTDILNWCYSEFDRWQTKTPNALQIWFKVLYTTSNFSTQKLEEYLPTYLKV